MPPVIIPAISSPTTSETSALAALVSSATAPSKSTAAILDEVLSLCRNPDIVSFLFTDDKVQLPYLTSPSLFSSAVTGTMTSTRVEPDHSRTCKIGPMSDFVAGKWVFVPSFSVSGVSLGFGMHEFNYSQGEFWSGNYMMYMRAEFRFVMNDAKGELLVLHDIPDMNACCMEYSRAVTPTCQTRTSICFFRDKLHEAAKDGYLDRTNITSALDQINTIYEYRNCLTCHRDHATCRCALQLTRARHPFDHQNLVNNLSLRLGTFEGVANVFCYDKGIYKRKSALGCRNTWHGGVDRDLITMLRDWAVGLHVAGTEDPLQAIVAPPVQNFSDADVHASEVTDEIDLSTEPYVEPGTFFLDDTDPFAILPPLDDMQNDLLALPHTVEDSLMEALNWKLPRTQPTAPSTTSRRSEGGYAEKKKTAQPLLDLTGTAALSSEKSSDGVATDGVDKELARKQRAEMRRIRNRESAQRSNMKKKITNDKLKLEIKTSKEKASHLRMHESKLRQENIRLRRLLSDAAS